MTDPRQHFFSDRIVNKWNTLRKDIVSASSLNNFKGKLQRLYNDGSSKGFFKSAWPSGSSQFPEEAQSGKLSGKLPVVAIRATGNSRFEMTEFPPPTEKFPFPKLTVFVGIHGTKSYQTSLQACIANVNDVEESLRPILESRREWNRSIPGCQTRSSYI